MQFGPGLAMHATCSTCPRLALHHVQTMPGRLHVPHIVHGLGPAHAACSKQHCRLDDIGPLGLSACSQVRDCQLLTRTKKTKHNA